MNRREAWPFYRYVLHLMHQAGLDPDTLTVEKIKERGTLLNRVPYALLIILESQGKKPIYDYIIIDEAQDLFNLGIDEVVDRLAAPANGLKNGNYIVFYDNSQAYRQAVDEPQENTWRQSVGLRNMLPFTSYITATGVRPEMAYMNL